MKIVFNTYWPDAVASYNYRGALSSMDAVALDDWGNYEKYDIALFMTYPPDLEELKRVSQGYPQLKIGLIDPRGSQVNPYVRYIDFLIIDSIEMKDFFAKYNLPMFTYYEYPTVVERSKSHSKKERVVIGYHGNKVHLMGMYPNLTKALELLNNSYEMEFWAMYNVEKVGRWDIGVPRNVHVKHIQWSEKNFERYLAQVDIGVVPNMMAIRNIRRIKEKAVISKRIFNDSQDDYLIRFKMPSNPGRFVVFGLLGIPVVADFLPSALQFIKDGYNGMLAYSTGGWYRALKALIESAELRNYLSMNMKTTIDEYFRFEKQNQKFLDFLEIVLNTPARPEKTNIETPDSDLSTDVRLFRRIVYLIFRRFVSYFKNIMK